MGIFGPKSWVNPFGKMSIFFLEYHKRHFCGLYCVKKKVGKIAIFPPKKWVNPFGKMSICRLFELFDFFG